MNFQGHIIAPRPIKKKQEAEENFFKRSSKNHNQENVCDSQSPFKIASNVPKIITQEIGKDLSIFSGVSGKFTPKSHNQIPCLIKSTRFLTTTKNINEEFLFFEKELTEELDDNNAKSEILSILSTDLNEQGINYYTTDNIRSSMPPIRPKNPFIKNFSNCSNNTGNPELVQLFPEYINNHNIILRNSVTDKIQN